MTDLCIPRDLWGDDKTGVIVMWLYEDGESVGEGATVAEIMVEKVQLEILAPASGTLRIRTKTEEPVRPGDVIGEIVP